MALGGRPLALVGRPQVTGLQRPVGGSMREQIDREPGQVVQQAKAIEPLLSGVLLPLFHGQLSSLSGAKPLGAWPARGM